MSCSVGFKGCSQVTSSVNSQALLKSLSCFIDNRKSLGNFELETISEDDDNKVIWEGIKENHLGYH